MLTAEALIVLGVLCALLVALALELYSVDLLMMLGLVVVVALGVIELESALLGFANSTILALASLYVIAAGLQKSGALELAARHLLGEKGGLRRALNRLCPSVAAVSAFLNNTPVVAMAIPAVKGWAHRRGYSPSKFLMPLSFAGMLGGTCTLIGTSTNLVTHGLLEGHDLPGLGFFELAAIGVPVTLVGWAYLVFIAPALIPERMEVREAEEEERSELLELEVEADSPLVGRTVDDAAVGRLPGHALARLQRGERGYGPVEPEQELAEGDVLSFELTEEGREAAEAAAADETDPEEILEARELFLRGYPGLKFRPRELEPEDVDPLDPHRELHEVVVKEGSALIGAPLETLEIPEKFGSVVTGVRRGGHRLEKPLGEIRLRPGDVIMLETGPHFREVFSFRPEFFVTTETEEEEADKEIRHKEEETPGIAIAVGILLGVVALTAAGIWHIAVSATLGAFFMVALGYLNPGEAREAVDWGVLVVIGAALGLGRALEESGGAEWLADELVGLLGALGDLGLLAGILLASILLTQLITNNGAAALLFPIALSMAASFGIDPRPLFIALTVGASTSLITPIGYQTNLMVYGPGNYHFLDFARVGGPLQILLFVVMLVVIPVFWGF